jgi:hypothetical protein
MAFFSAAALLSGGCTAVTDPSRFDLCGGGRRSLVAELTGFEELSTARIEIIATGELTGEVATRAVVDTLHPEHDVEAGVVRVFLPCALPRGSFDARVFVDEDGNGAYTPPAMGNPGDLAFLEPIAPGGSVRVDRDRSPQADISENLVVQGREPFVMNLTNMSPHTPGTQRLELRVIDVTPDDPATPFVSGYYRNGDIVTDDFVADVPSSIVPGRAYRVDFYADLDDSGAYEGPPRNDHSWTEPAPPRTDTEEQMVFVGGADGLVVDFNHRGSFDDIPF